MGESQPSPTPAPTITPPAATSDHIVISSSGNEIHVIYEITLGDIAIFTVLSLLLAFHVFKWMAGKVWEEKQHG